MVSPVESIIEMLRLEPLADEGGLWSQVLIDEHSTAIFYLLQGHDFSALHRLPGPEVYHHYMGAPLEMLLLHPDGSASRPVLGIDLTAGQRPAVVVPGGVWQGSRSRGAWTLVGTTMSPPFRFGDLQLGDPDGLCDSYPAVTSDIRSLTR